MEENQNNNISTNDTDSSQNSQPTTEESVPPTQPLQQKKSSGGVNKYVILVAVLALIIISGAVYRAFFLPEAEKPVVTGIERFIDVVVHEDTWAFTPEFLEVDQGDKLIMNIVNKDDYDHGFAIDAFGISQRMPALSTIRIDFIVTKAGDFPYYCSVSCGSGVIDGEKRGHFDQIGRLHVKSIISETSGIDTSKTIDFAAETRKATMLKEALRELEALGRTVTEEEIIIDENNVLWLERSRTVELLEGINYQALYYKNPGTISGGVWIFIDTTTGEVIDTAFDE